MCTSAAHYATDGVVHAGNRLRTQLIMTDERDVMARGDYRAIPPSALAPNGAQAFAAMSPRWATCAVVGNSGSLLFTKYGRQIDAADVVVRMNQVPVGGRYAPHVGSKTTIRIINRSWTLGYADNPDVNPKLRWSSWPHPLERGVSLLSLFSGPGNWMQLVRFMRGRLRKKPKDLGLFYLNDAVFTRAKDALAAHRKCYEATRARPFKGGVTPSTGLVALFLLRPMCKELTLYGAGTEETSGMKYQYYQLQNTEREKGNVFAHSFDAEMRVFMDLNRMGAPTGGVSFCGLRGCGESAYASYPL